MRARLAALVLLGLLSLAGCDRLPGGAGAVFKAHDITGAEYGKTLELTDHTGQPRTLADFKGKLVVLFFGYTQCPDVCPTTLATMADVMKQLGPEADRVQVIFVTLDPQQDTRTVLSGYVTAFDPRFMALSGDDAATARTAKEFKVFYAKAANPGSTSYTIDHTANTYVLDTQGRVRLLMKHGTPAADVVSDLKALLAKG